MVGINQTAISEWGADVDFQHVQNYFSVIDARVEMDLQMNAFVGSGHKQVFFNHSKSGPLDERAVLIVAI